MLTFYSIVWASTLTGKALCATCRPTARKCAGGGRGRNVTGPDPETRDSPIHEWVRLGHLRRSFGVSIYHGSSTSSLMQTLTLCR